MESFSENIQEEVEEHVDIKPYALNTKTVTMSLINAKTEEEEPVFKSMVKVIETSDPDRLTNVRN